MKNQEEEPSVLYVASSPQTDFLSPNEETDLELPPTSANDDSSCSKEPIYDQQKTNCLKLRTDDATTNAGIRLDPNSNSDSDALQTSLLKDIPFADDREESDFTGNVFPSKHECELQRKSSQNSRRRLGKLETNRAFIVKSSLQRIGGGDRPKVISVNSRSPSPDQTVAGRAFRRRSKFKSIRRMRYGESAPRMSAKDRKLLQMILVIFSSFLVCYLPITVTKLFHSTIDWRGLNIAGYILIYVTTCINPVIYVMMSSEYRSAYKYVLLCKHEQAMNKRRPPALLMPS